MKKRLAMLLCVSMILGNGSLAGAEELSDGSGTTNSQTVEAFLPEEETPAAENPPQDLLNDGVSAPSTVSEQADNELLPTPTPEAPEVVETLSQESMDNTEFLDSESVGEASYPIPLTEQVFPDRWLRVMLSPLDVNGDQMLSQEEAEAVTTLKITDENAKEGYITSLQGLERFPNLVSLDCSYNQIKSLDRSLLEKLEELNCSHNTLTALDVSNLPRLKTLDCSNNHITELKVAGASALKELNCSNNQMQIFYAENAKAMEWLQCDGNYLEHLSVRNMGALQTLSCSANALTSLDLSGLSNLKTLLINQNHLTALNLSPVSRLETLSCRNNLIRDLRVTHCTGLEYLDCSYNRLTKVDVSGLSHLKKLDVRGNQLVSISKVVGRNPNIPLFNYYQQQENDDYRTQVTSLKNTARGIQVQWKKAPAATGYYLYRKMSSESAFRWTYIKTISGNASTSYVDTGVVSGVTYQYMVRASDVDPEQYVINRTGMSIRCLAMPRIKGITNRSNGIYFKWSPSAGAQGYTIYRKNPGAGWKKIATVNGSTTSYTDQSIKDQNGSVYAYTVAATWYQTKSAYVSSGTTFARVRHVSLKKYQPNAGGTALVQWSINGRATGYRIQYADNASFKNATTVTIRGYKNTQTTLKGLKPGQKYYLRVLSFRKIGSREYKSAWSGVRNFVAQ